MGARLERVLGALNGLVGDRLEQMGNGLATTMGFVAMADARALSLTPQGLQGAHPMPTGRVAVLVHGLMDTERGFRAADGSDFGTRLGSDTGRLPLWVRYNSGRPIADNGRLLAELLDRLVAAYPAPLHELVLIGHSLGGLVVRAACHVAATRGDTTWLPRVRQAFYLATPHHGAPLERAGRVVARVIGSVGDPYTQLAAQLADLRSRGVKDLGDPAHPVPLLHGIAHYLVVGSISRSPWLSSLFGDSIVPVGSASDGHVPHPAIDPAILPSHVAYFPGVSHPRIPRHDGVYQRLRSWVEELP